MDHCKNVKQAKEPKQAKLPNNQCNIRQDQRPNCKSEIRQKEYPEKAYSSKISWGLGYIDMEGNWPLPIRNKAEFKSFLIKLKSFESMSVSEIYTQKSKNNHGIDIDDLNKCAIKRLNELDIHEDKIHSLRLEGKIRVYGILRPPTMYILWYDDNHGDNNTCVCRSRKKHT